MLELDHPYPTFDDSFCTLIKSSHSKLKGEAIRNKYKSERPGIIASLKLNSNINVRPISENVDLIEFIGARSFYEDPVLKSSQLNIIIFLCGGAFAIIDNTDLHSMERFLPLLVETGNSAKVYSIIYETDADLVNGAQDSLIGTVERQLVLGFEKIINHATGSMEAFEEADVRLMIIGQSAGGNLAFNFIPYLKNKFKETFSNYFRRPHLSIKLCLSSPWVDLYSTEASPYFVQHEKHDFLLPNGLIAARNKYLHLCEHQETISQTSRNFQISIFAYILAIELSHRDITTAVFDVKDCLRIENNTRIKSTELKSFLDGISAELIAVFRCLQQRGIHIQFMLRPRSEQDHPLPHCSGTMSADELLRATAEHILPPHSENIIWSVFDYKPRPFSLLSWLYHSFFGGCAPVLQFPGSVIFSSLNKDGIVDPETGFNLRSAIVWIREKYRGPSSLTNVNATEALDAVLQELVDMHMDTVLQTVTRDIPHDARALLGAANPLMASEETLADIPPSLIFAGEKELFLEQIMLFHKRLRKAQRSADGEGVSRLVVAKNDVHGFACFWRNPIHRMLDNAGYGWLFYWFHPHRYYAWRSYGRRRIPSDRYVHSKNADRAIQMMVNFFISAPIGSN